MGFCGTHSFTLIPTMYFYPTYFLNSRSVKAEKPLKPPPSQATLKPPIMQIQSKTNRINESQGKVTD